MAGITGMGLTFNLPNFVGDLFTISPEDTPLLSAIGGLTGGREAPDKTFEWEFYDLRDADETRQALEGANAPTAEERVRANANNVLEIHHEAVSISYTKLSVGASGTYGTTARGTSPVADEMAWQMEQQIKQVARDVELTFIIGEYDNPVNNATPRKTRGILEAIATNVIDLNGAQLTEEDVNDLFQLAYDNGGLLEGETRTLLVGTAMKRQITKVFLTDHDLQPLSRNVGGVNLQTIVTDFGTANVMVDRYMPVDTVAALSLEELAPRFLNVPGRGHFFWEPLAKVGSADNSQLYGEIGLEYGNERKHAKITNAATAFGTQSGT
jgi:hypothetical protein